MRFSAFLAILALFGMMTLASWHDALPHVHDGGHIISVDQDHHDHAPDGQPDTADLMHMAAHAVLQNIDVSAPPIMAESLTPAAAIWTMGLSEMRRSIAPLSILRPPRG